MKHKKRIVGFVLGLVLVAGVVWVMLAPRDPLFHGKPESYWLTNIAYGMSLSEDQNKEQVQRWRDFGLEGLRVLERGLSANRGQAYRKFYSRLGTFMSGGVMRLLPVPLRQTDQGTRQCVLDLLHRMGKDARPAFPTNGCSLLSRCSKRCATSSPC